MSHDGVERRADVVLDLPNLEVEERAGDDLQGQGDHVVVDVPDRPVRPAVGQPLRGGGHVVDVVLEAVRVEDRFDDAALLPPGLALGGEDAVAQEGHPGGEEAPLAVVRLLADEDTVHVVGVEEAVHLPARAELVPHDVAVLRGGALEKRRPVPGERPEVAEDRQPVRSRRALALDVAVVRRPD